MITFIREAQAEREDVNRGLKVYVLHLLYTAWTIPNVERVHSCPENDEETIMTRTLNPEVVFFFLRRDPLSTVNVLCVKF